MPSVVSGGWSPRRIAMARRNSRKPSAAARTSSRAGLPTVERRSARSNARMTPKRGRTRPGTRAAFAGGCTSVRRQSDRNRAASPDVERPVFRTGGPSTNPSATPATAGPT